MALFKDLLNKIRGNRSSRTYPRYVIKHTHANRAHRRRVERMIRRGYSLDSINNSVVGGGDHSVELPNLMWKVLGNWFDSYRKA